MNQVYKYIFVIFVLMGISISSYAIHQYYVSICQIDHNPKSETLEITFKIFTDDLERALEEQGKYDIELGTPKEHPATDSLIAKYIYDHFELKIDGLTKPMYFLGKEAELEATWCYVEVYKVPEIKELFIYNSILVDVFDDQNNLIHLNYKGEKSSLILHRGNVRKEVTF